MRRTDLGELAGDRLQATRRCRQKFAIVLGILLDRFDPARIEPGAELSELGEQLFLDTGDGLEGIIVAL